ncbi:hypothetical protein FJV46_06475 [Arthrobacter agilis]|nr:hypothetical protein [Arthrobacter agilis]TPV26511.1 hypothetical protein FJV46_06475 [Arthrobacter agilis]VDR33576.1 Uncharacterised protein [Arthrobacter agilis]
MDDGAEAWAGPRAGCRTGGQVGEEIDAMVAALAWHVARLTDVQRHALSVTLLSWESPAGAAFRSYLAARCADLSRTIDLLESAARDLRSYGLLVQEAEATVRAVGPP